MINKKIKDNQLYYYIYLCSKEINNLYTKLLDEIDLTYTQFIVMKFFWNNKKCNVRKLSSELKIDSSTLTPLLKKLELKKYITREKSNLDGRNLILKITDNGEKIKNKAMSISNSILKKIDLNDGEEKYLFNITNKILSNLNKEG